MIYQATSTASTMLASLLLTAWTDPNVRAFCLYLLSFILATEVAFYLYMTNFVYPKLRALTTPVPNIRGPKGSLDIIMRQLELLNGFYSRDRFLTSWFRGASMDEIRLGNLREHLAWSVFACEEKDMSPSQNEILDEAVSYVMRVAILDGTSLFLS